MKHRRRLPCQFYKRLGIRHQRLSQSSLGHLISSTDEETWAKADIFDVSGRIIRSISLDGLSIDVGGLESGAYFIRVKNGEKVGLVKFVKM
ncbi:MAG: T9SS type A sorting domain-containing protein [Saprospiraceae bacterium]|nr:T9SS type A sorting domain-containing protein [Saprospiraceae bacterium]